MALYTRMSSRLYKWGFTPQSAQKAHTTRPAARKDHSYKSCPDLSPRSSVTFDTFSTVYLQDGR
jgi:hypothetical protein